jgi:ABC-type antimicrobial peptide transport system permease subunit
MIRASVPPETLIQSVRGAVASVNSSMQPASFLTMEQLVYDSVARPRLNTVLLAAFAALALALAAVGIYGVIAYSVSRRAHEIGVRMALGARPRAVYQLVLRQAGQLIAMGLIVGLACSLVASTLMRKLLFGTPPWDLPTLTTVAAVLAGSALLASYIPARRAASVNPIEVMRAD